MAVSFQCMTKSTTIKKKIEFSLLIVLLVYSIPGSLNSGLFLDEC